MAQAFNDNEMARKFQIVSLSHQTTSRRLDEIHVTNKLENLIHNGCFFLLHWMKVRTFPISRMLVFIITVIENYSYSEELIKLR